MTNYFCIGDTVDMTGMECMNGFKPGNSYILDLVAPGELLLQDKETGTRYNFWVAQVEWKVGLTFICTKKF